MTAVTPRAATAGTMTAIVQDTYGTAPEDVLRLAETARPAIAADEVLVRVHAASVDRGTWHLMTGLPYPLRLAGPAFRAPRVPNPGRCLAGTVESAGPNVTGLKPGDEVYGTGDASFARALAPRGRLVIMGGETGGRWLDGLDRQLRALLLSPLVHQKLGTFIASENSADLRILGDLIDSGQITPTIDRSYPLSQAAAAIRYLQEGRACGKIVITV